MDHCKNGLLFMSNYHEPTDQASSVLRQLEEAAGREERTAPLVAKESKMWMGRIDNANRQRASFSTRRRSSKWWFPLFTFTINTQLNNAYMVYTRYNFMKRGAVKKGRSQGCASS